MVRDIGILWEWEYDERFVALVDSVCQREGRTSYLVAPHNLEESLARMKAGELFFRVVLDRATDGDPAFLPVLRFHQERNCRIINDPEKAARTHNRAVMHLELMNSGLFVPHTLMFSPGDSIDEHALETIGRPFVLKTVEGQGGGEGVVVGARFVRDIERLREQYPEKMILAQQHITPREFRGRRCWFRVFFTCGKVIPCFWDDRTHVYHRLIPEEEELFKELFSITRVIHQIAALEFFSTEVVQTVDGKFVVVDYINDQCDMRFQSDTPDGVPDSVIEEIARAIVLTL